MKTYQIKLTLHSGTLTPFQSDTVFGHLCWVVAHQEGDNGLQEFLKPFKDGKPPFVISDGFPTDLLPKPLTTEFNIDDSDERKELKKIDFVTLEDFNRIRKSEKCKPYLLDVQMRSVVTFHNTINRLTYTTPTEGSIYSLEETFIPNISIYVKVTSEEWKDRIVELFKEISEIGYGRKKSIGKGQFSIEEVITFNFSAIEEANAFVTLSNFCPAENDPTEGIYKTFVKYGKLGEEFTFCGNPFKRPLLMIKTGSVFKTNTPSKEFYGRIVQDGIAPVKSEVVQYAYAFAVPLIYPKA